MGNDIYCESPEISEFSRREYAASLESFVSALEEKSKASRDAHMMHETYFADIEHYRKQFINMLGFPLDQYKNEPASLSREFVGSDSVCNIYRLKIEAMPGLNFSGLYMVPHTEARPAPLVIAAHGALGTPELMYGMHGKNGYSNLISRILARGARVFAPQLLLWNKGQSPQKPKYATDYDRQSLDLRLKSLGGSMTALEVFCLMRSVDCLASHPESAFSTLGFAGMSYGAYLGLHMMAADTRINCGYLCGCFNERLRYRFPEWHYQNDTNTFLDAEIAALCAPRALFIEVGRRDDIFDWHTAESEANRTRSYYKSAGFEKSFRFSVWEGAHLVNPADEGLDFLFQNL